MDFERLQKLVNKHRVGSLALVTPKNTPHNTPVWINYSKEYLYVFTRDYRSKTNYAKLNPHCMISYDDGAIEGTIELIFRGSEEYEQIMDVSDSKYGDDPGYPSYKQNWNAAMKITPTKLHIF